MGKVGIITGTGTFGGGEQSECPRAAWAWSASPISSSFRLHKDLYLFHNDHFRAVAPQPLASLVHCQTSIPIPTQCALYKQNTDIICIFLQTRSLVGFRE